MELRFRARRRLMWLFKLLKWRVNQNAARHRQRWLEVFWVAVQSARYARDKSRSCAVSQTRDLQSTGLGLKVQFPRVDGRDSRNRYCKADEGQESWSTSTQFFFGRQRWSQKVRSCLRNTLIFCFTFEISDGWKLTLKVWAQIAKHSEEFESYLLSLWKQIIQDDVAEIFDANSKLITSCVVPVFNHSDYFVGIVWASLNGLSWDMIRKRCTQFPFEKLSQSCVLDLEIDLFEVWICALRDDDSQVIGPIKTARPLSSHHCAQIFNVDRNGNDSRRKVVFLRICLHFFPCHLHVIVKRSV